MVERTEFVKPDRSEGHYLLVDSVQPDMHTCNLSEDLVCDDSGEVSFSTLNYW